VQIAKTLATFAVAVACVCAAAPARAATLTLAWDPSSDPSVAGYLVEYGTQSGLYSLQRDVGNVLQASIDALTAGTAYYFVVVAYDTTGHRSAPSNEVVATPISTASISAPSQITALSLVSSVPSPQVTGTAIQWSAAANGGVTPYQYQWTVANNGVVVQSVAWSTASTFGWTPKTASSNYAITVAARSANSATGAAEMTQTMPFTITAPVTSSSKSVPAIASLTLLSAPSNKPIAGYNPLVDGATVSLAQTGSRLNIRANVSGTPSRVTFVLDGTVTTTDRTAPYFMLSGGGKGSIWTPSIGTHTLSVTAYGNDATAGLTYSISFTVMN